MIVMLLAPYGIPPIACGHAADVRRIFESVGGRLSDPIEEWPPDCFGLVGSEAARDHGNLKRVVGLEMCLLTPVVVEKRAAVKTDELADETAECIVRRGFDSEAGSSGKLGEVV